MGRFEFNKQVTPLLPRGPATMSSRSADFNLNAAVNGHKKAQKSEKGVLRRFQWNGQRNSCGAAAENSPRRQPWVTQFGRRSRVAAKEKCCLIANSDAPTGAYRPLDSHPT